MSSTQTNVSSRPSSKVTLLNLFTMLFEDTTIKTRFTRLERKENVQYILLVKLHFSTSFERKFWWQTVIITYGLKI